MTRGWAAGLRRAAGRRPGPRARLSAATVDRLLAGALLVWALFDVPWWWRPPGHAGSTPVILATTGLAAAQSVPFLWRRSRPPITLALAGAALTVKFAEHVNIWSAGAAVLAAAYGLGAYGTPLMRRAARLLAGAALTGALAATLAALRAGLGDHSATVAGTLLITALVLGEVTSAHRDIATAAARHAHDLERAGLARELHDILAHQLSAIAVQAGAARLASAGDPRAAGHAIAVIEQEARTGLRELNQLVRGMRRVAADGGASRAGGGVPQLADLPRLVQQARASGLRAELHVAGEPARLGAEVELAGYRVVQESLTNSIRYAPGAAATVHVAYRADGIAVDVLDDGPDPLGAGALAGQGGGTGLAGLSERVRLLGGHLEAGARPDGGFSVRAFLPAAR
ncbi:MAG TPA: histidine kinase [Streptosporangiaceae bacterium]|nr:histidine kinase [Streptosporangiaceae bacterium]